MAHRLLQDLVRWSMQGTCCASLNLVVMFRHTSTLQTIELREPDRSLVSQAGLPDKQHHGCHLALNQVCLILWNGGDPQRDTVGQLAEFLLLFRALVETAVSERGDDAYLDGDIPLVALDRAATSMRAVDPTANQPGAMWHNELRAVA